MPCNYAGVVELADTAGSNPAADEACEFKSHHQYHSKLLYWGIAKLVRHRTLTPTRGLTSSAGSSPATPANGLGGYMPRKSDGVAKITKKIPSSECGSGVLCETRSGKRYQITQSQEKKKHTLWKVVDDGYEKIATGDSPYALYTLIDWDS